MLLCGSDAEGGAVGEAVYAAAGDDPGGGAGAGCAGGGAVPARRDVDWDGDTAVGDAAGTIGTWVLPTNGG